MTEMDGMAGVAESAEGMTLSPTPMVLEIRFLNDRVMAAQKESRNEPEWPLHPSRLFSAIVAALHGINEADPAFPASEAAVLWLEALGPPDVHASEGHAIPSVLAYVPFNDQAVLRDGKSRGLEACLPDSPRRKKGRQFPGVTVDERVIRYAWAVDPEEVARHRSGLQRILARIVYFGRSVNFVIVHMLEVPPGDLPHAEALQHWRPSPTGRLRMRTVGEGRLAHLRDLYNKGMPVDRGGYTFYARVDEDDGSRELAVASSWHGLWTVFATPRTSATTGDTEAFAKTIRGAINRRSQAVAWAAMPDDLRPSAPPLLDPFISGHDADGSPARMDRLAVVPLGNIMHPHADGRLLGFALLMPAASTPEQWQLASEAIYGTDGDGGVAPLAEIPLGRGGSIQVVRTEHNRVFGLGPDRYMQATRTWTTVTPILLSRRPDSGRRRAGAPEVDPTRVRDQVLRDCVAAGLPRPVAVEVSTVSHLQGVGHARSFRQSGSGPPKWATHATITFDRPVSGPVLVGAGRYNGLGLMTPVRNDDVSQDEGDA